MRILALDLGTSLGWAVGHTAPLPDVESCGVVPLATPAEITRAGKTRMNRRLDPRIPAMHFFLANLHLRTPVDWIVFEDVEFVKSRMQAHLWASYRTVAWLFAARHNLGIECCATGALKTFATGHGGADKAMMERALLRNDTRFTRTKLGLTFSLSPSTLLTDDTVDAVHLLKWARKTLANIKK